MKKIFLILLFIPLLLKAEEIILNGRVFSRLEGNPLYLANVIIEGTSKGTPTDKNGEFKITVSKLIDKVIVVSFMGYETQKIIIDTINIKNPLFVYLDKKILNSQTVLIEGITGKKHEQMFTYSDLKKNDIQDKYTTQDLPEMISYLPSTMFYSEGGNGIGYNYLNIRGFDQRRISVSVNGIPQNEPEDNNVYWLDMPDLLSNTELIQIQRGAGSGISGYPSIGGSINIITSNFSDKANSSLGFGIGDYNTRKYSISVGSGVVDEKYSFYFSLSNLLSTGYRDNSWSDFKSYYLSAVRFDKNVTTQINVFGGIVKDGLAYTGLPKFAITNTSLRTLNHSYWSADEKNFTYELMRRPEEKEEFSQPHFEILNEVQINKDVVFNSALFLIIGSGYFDYDASWADSNYFRLTNANGFNTTTNPGNAIIRAMVENKQWGWIPRLSIKHTNGELITGAEVRIHRSVHWGSINYGENLPAGLTPNFRYYYYEGGKDIFNFFVNENYRLSDNIKLMGEVQLAYNKYKLFNEKYTNYDFSINNFFINPRIGINYKLTENFGSYFSAAYVTREPRLKNYYDAAESSGGAVPQFETDVNGNYNFDNPLVKPEKMLSFDLGINYKNSIMDYAVNLYLMQFKDEIISNGQLDRFGQPITGNMNKTIHYGVELSTVTKPNSFLEIAANININKNYIQDGFTYIEDNATGTIVKQDLSDNKIGGFPNILFNTIVKATYNNLSVQFLAKYLGKFYSDNYDDNLNKYLNLFPGFVEYSDNVVEPYFLANVIVNYEFGFDPVFKNVKFTFQINNIFNKLYASYAYGKEFFPGAERNYYFSTRVNF